MFSALYLLDYVMLYYIFIPGDTYMYISSAKDCRLIPMKCYNDKLSLTLPPLIYTRTYQGEEEIIRLVI